MALQADKIAGYAVKFAAERGRYAATNKPGTT
jgi:hypothetical protein